MYKPLVSASLTNEPIDPHRYENLYAAFLRPPCDSPYQSDEGFEEVKRLAKQTFCTNSEKEFSQTCRCISHIVRNTTPKDQNQCIELLDAFPWDNPYSLKLIDSSVPFNPLIEAVYQELPEVIKYLIKTRGIDVDMLNSDGMSALIWAVKKKKPALVELLLNLNANPFLCTPAGKRAIDYIDQFTPKEIYEMLDKKEKELIASNPDLAIYTKQAASQSTSGYSLVNSNRYNCSYLKKPKKGEYFKLASDEPEETSQPKLKRD